MQRYTLHSVSPGGSDRKTKRRGTQSIHPTPIRAPSKKATDRLLSLGAEAAELVHLARTFCDKCKLQGPSAAGSEYEWRPVLGPGSGRAGVTSSSKDLRPDWSGRLQSHTPYLVPGCGWGLGKESKVSGVCTGRQGKLSRGKFRQPWRVAAESQGPG